MSVLTETDPNLAEERDYAAAEMTGAIADAYLQADQRGGSGSNGKPSLTIDEAAVQLTRDQVSWADNWGQAATVTFAFRSTAPGSMPDDTSGFSRFNTAQINATLLALQAWSDVANITFNRVGSGVSGSSAYSNSATILFGNYSSGSEGAAAFAYYPYSFAYSSEDGDVWVNNSLGYNANPQMFNYGQLVLVHEIGHAIGLSHPGDYNAGPDQEITYAANAEYYEDSMQYSVMSYFYETYTGASYGSPYPATVMLDDIAAAQRLYGANMTTRTGDTTYGFNSNAERAWFSATSSASTLIFAAWDAGGTDTFDFSGYASAQKIDLRQGNFSDVGGLIGNVAVAKGAVIENAIGGAGADTVIGNNAANRLQGNGGNDTLTGGAGADVFVFTKSGGADIVTDFTIGSDKLDGTAFGSYLSIVQSGADTLVTFETGQTALLKGITASSISDSSFVGVHAAPPEVLTLNGTAGADVLNGGAGDDFLYGLGGNDKLYGNGGADTLEGGAGDDRIDGGSGADVMRGGIGSDGYHVDNAGDQVIEDAAAGTDRVTSAITYTLGANLENLTLSGAKAIAGTGNTLNNSILGNAAANTLKGGTGNDRIEGAGGADTIAGNSGYDVFVYREYSDSTVSAPDRIKDFYAPSDKVDLSLLDADLGASGNQTFVWQDAFTGHAGEAVLTYDAASNTTILTLDNNGDGAADFKLLFTGHLTGGDGFLL